MLIEQKQASSSTAAVKAATHTSELVGN